MLPADVLASQLGRVHTLIWASGAPVTAVDDNLLPDPVTVTVVDPADVAAVAEATAAAAAAGAAALLVADLPSGESPAPDLTLPWPVRPPGSRTVLLSRQPLGSLTAEAVAAAVGRAGLRLVHAVRLDPSGGLPRRSALLLTSEAAAADELSEHARTVLNAATGTEETGDAERDLLDVLEQLVVQSIEQQRREDELRQALATATQELAVARRTLRAVRGSAAMQLGRGLADVLANPRSGLRRLPGRVKAARAARGTVPPLDDAVPTVEPQTPTGRRLPVPTGRRRTFDLALPSRAAVESSEFAPATAPERLTIDVPYPMYVPLRLQRLGLAGYETESMAWWLALLDTAPPGEVWDIGANTGIYGLVAAALSTRSVVGFEPTPDLAAWARHTAYANGLDMPVEQVAAADHDGTATFYLSDSTDSSSSLAAGFRESTRQLEVLTERLDTYAARTGSTATVWKVDTESTEPSVLRGGLATIERCRPWMLVEVLATCGVEEPLMELTRPLGYRWYHLTDDEPVEADQIVGDPTFTHFMYLFAPEAVDEPLRERARAWRRALAACEPLSPPT